MRPCKCDTPRRTGRQALLAVLGSAAGLLLLTCGYLSLLGGTSVPVPAIGGPFQLTSSDGQPVTDRSFRGRYVLAYFGYTSCRDVCPTTLTAVADALDVLGPKAERVQPLFITVDPARDTPDVLRRYVGGFSPRLLGLTGTPRQIAQMQRDYRVTSIVHPASAPGADYAVDHSSVLYLIGPDGRYLAPIRADETGAKMAADIVAHLS